MRDAYKIRMEVSPFDFKMYSMTIPTDLFPQFEGRCTLLKGPSRTFWFRHYNLFEDCVGINIDEATKKEVMVTRVISMDVKWDLIKFGNLLN